MSMLTSSTHGGAISERKAKVKSVHFDKDGTMTVRLQDGRAITVPLKWYPRLAKASKKDRETWEPCGAGHGIHWPKIDEDLSVEGLLNGIPSVEYKAH